MQNETLQSINKSVKSRNKDRLLEVEEAVSLLSKKKLTRLFFIFSGMADYIDTNTDLGIEETRLQHKILEIQEDILGQITLNQMEDSNV